mgnify:FL=1
MRILSLMAVLLLAGCDERRSLCEKAVDKHIAKFGSYKITRFSEEDGEGKGISVYNVDYIIKNNNLKPISKSLDCHYVDGIPNIYIYDN